MASDSGKQDTVSCMEQQEQHQEKQWQREQQAALRKQKVYGTQGPQNGNRTEYFGTPDGNPTLL